ncbi:uncharacterized [Tachysurus ichikawai]
MTSSALTSDLSADLSVPLFISGIDLLASDRYVVRVDMWNLLEFHRNTLERRDDELGYVAKNYNLPLRPRLANIANAKI